MTVKSLKPLPKVQRPETPGQAAHWDKTYSAYKTSGFCRRCASQAAWGHQNGFTNTQPIWGCCRGKQVPNPNLERATAWANSEPQRGPQ